MFNASPLSDSQIDICVLLNMLDFEVVNIKLSLKLNSISYQDILNKVQSLQINQQLNFIVVFQKYTYSIFKPTKVTGNLHCNATKLREFSDIHDAINLLHILFPEATLNNITVDNITSTTKCDRKQNLNKLFSKLNYSYSLKYNLQKFPAIFIKIPVEDKKLTVFIFASGKVVCVGAKTENHLKLISSWVKTEINNTL